MADRNQRATLREALKVESVEPTLYEFEVPKELCYGITQAHKAGAHFNANRPDGRSKPHVHLNHVALNFARPTYPEQPAQIRLRKESVNRFTTLLHIQILQNEKVNVAGYMTFGDLKAPSALTVEPQWKLDPAPLAIDLEAVEKDKSTDWITYTVPFAEASYRQAQSYVKYAVPVKSQSRAYIDQWLRLDFEDKELPSGPVWTDELLHFLVDTSLPTLYDLIEPNAKDGKYEALVKGGQLQRQARREGKSDAIWGEGQTDADFIWIVSDMAVMTEIKRPLPAEGVRWLFMRTTTKTIMNNRTDYLIDVLNEKGELIATTHHLMQVIPVAQKMNAKM